MKKIVVMMMVIGGFIACAAPARVMRIKTPLKTVVMDYGNFGVTYYIDQETGMCYVPVADSLVPIDLRYCFWLSQEME